MAFQFASIGGQSVYYTDYNSGPNKYRDVVESDVITNNAVMTVSFTTAVPAVSSTPFVISIRPV